MSMKPGETTLPVASSVRAAVARGEIVHRGNAVAANTHVGRDAGLPGAVYHRAVADDQIEFHRGHSLLAGIIAAQAAIQAPGTGPVRFPPPSQRGRVRVGAWHKDTGSAALPVRVFLLVAPHAGEMVLDLVRGPAEYGHVVVLMMHRADSVVGRDQRAVGQLDG